MESFYGENPGIDNSGTNEEPLNLGWIRGKKCQWEKVGS